MVAVAPPQLPAAGSPLRARLASDIRHGTGYSGEMVRHPLAKRRNTTASGPEQKNVHPAAELVIDEDRCRAELWDTIDGERTFIGFIGYALEDRGGIPVTRLMHTIINERFGRQGYARCLVTLLLDRLIAEDRRFTSECSYIDHYLKRYPEYRKNQAVS
ncbi:hypothetical protein GCM10025777_52140 [Membranihabitans marinus]|uniref:N-acetyltransferase domain-containing protein n=2 Tax=Nesterenkonia TaxID=57494 RepID=A0ABP9FQZ0_9MICC